MRKTKKEKGYEEHRTLIAAVTFKLLHACHATSFSLIKGYVFFADLIIPLSLMSQFLNLTATRTH